LQPVAIGDVQALKLLELDQQFSGPGCVVTITFQARNKRTLPGDVLLSLGDMALGQRQMLQYGGSIWQATRITREAVRRSGAALTRATAPTAAPLRAISARHIL
jgi:hypothetical protein